MSECTHDLAERESACADGYCPICLQAKLMALRLSQPRAVPDDTLERREQEWSALQAAIDEYMGDYAYDDGDATHEPTELESVLLNDAIQGLFGDDAFVKAIAQVYPVRIQHATPQPPVEREGDTLPVRADLIEFLRGAGELDGMWFGETNGRAAFWWRKFLPEPPATTQPKGAR